MILQEIRLTDFRCFYGNATIVFSRHSTKNVTVIYAENGLGKTTILNALLWCFYGETTARFEKKKDIINYDARKAGRKQASVEVLFEHNNRQYIARRYSSEQRFSRRPFVVAPINRGSQGKGLSNPDDFINTVIPRDMASHFLFDGEHAEVFLGESNRKSIRSAVRNILGCSLIEQAMEDLRAIANQYRKQIPSTATTSEISQLNKRLDELSLNISRSNDEIERRREHVEVTKTQIRDIEGKLRNSAAAKELQKSRDQLESQSSRAEKRRREHDDEVYKWLGENGRFVVSRRICSETLDFLQDKEHRGQIPSPYNEEFVKDLLEAEQCICGGPLKPGSNETRLVSGLLRRAANQSMRDRITKVRARLSNLKSERAKAGVRLNVANKRLAEANEELDYLEAEIAGVGEKLKGIDLEDIAKRERRREQLVTEVENTNQKIGSLKRAIATAKKEEKKINRDINSLSAQDKRTAIFGRRRELCETIRSTLEDQLVSEEEEARRTLRNKMNKVLKATTRKILNLNMSDDYIISLVNVDGVELPKSGGENQLLGLIFTAALVEFAKERMNNKQSNLLPGTIAPLVLDSPFGQLDDSYRATTAKAIPNMARQVVLMVSQSQGSSEVLRELEGRIGSEYVLVRHNKEAIGDRTPERRHLADKTINTVMFDSKFDGTEILRVSTP